MADKYKSTLQSLIIKEIRPVFDLFPKRVFCINSLDASIGPFKWTRWVVGIEINKLQLERMIKIPTERECLYPFLLEKINILKQAILNHLTFDLCQYIYVTHIEFDSSETIDAFQYHISYYIKNNISK